MAKFTDAEKRAVLRQAAADIAATLAAYEAQDEQEGE